jgi:hypothetical protein
VFGTSLLRVRAVIVGLEFRLRARRRRDRGCRCGAPCQSRRRIAAASARGLRQRHVPPLIARVCSRHRVQGVAPRPPPFPSLRYTPVWSPLGRRLVSRCVDTRRTGTRPAPNAFTTPSGRRTGLRAEWLPVRVGPRKRRSFPARAGANTCAALSTTRGSSAVGRTDIANCINRHDRLLAPGLGRYCGRTVPGAFGRPTL